MAYRYRVELPKSAQTGDILLVVHDFEARSNDELNLRKGDKVELLELDDGFGDGWYLGKSIDHGVTGLFPGVYTTIVPKPKLPPTGVLIATKPGSAAPTAIMANRISSDSTPTASFVDSSSRQMPKHGGATDSIATMSTSASPSLQRSISEAMVGGDEHGQDSPVMNETLSVIDEHMTEMNTPRHSFIGGAERRGTNDSGSEYSSHLDHRMSYITGHETDEEEDSEKLTEQEVLKWSPNQAAAHLRSLGIENRHCEIFEEQEISGEVLLGMDQTSIFMKEFDLGVVGRRLRTWHKIKSFQDEVKGPRQMRRTTPSFSGGESSAESLEPSQSRTGTLLPRIPSLMEKPGTTHNFRQSRQATYPQLQTPLQDQFQIPPPVPPHASLPTPTIGPARSNASSPFTPGFIPSGPDSPKHSPRPSAASIRELGHSRRHSSMEVPSRSAAETILAGSPTRSSVISHKKEPSFDRNWTMSGPPPSFNNRSGSSLTQMQVMDPSDTPLQHVVSMPDELDRGYFSGGELDNRRTRNVLRKRDSMSVSANHSRQSSVTEEQNRRSTVGGRRHSRLASADSVRDSVPNFTSSASKAYYSSGFRGRFRSASAKTGSSSPREMHSPTVTNLEADARISPALTTPSPRTDENVAEKKGSPQLSLQIRNSVSRARRGIGLRAISDAVTGSEKALVTSPSSIPSPVKESPMQSPTITGSSTPSGASKSFDSENPDPPAKGANGLATLPPPLTSRRSKTKKDTSAYTRGLEKKTPKEQIENCDYSGWMKKKSSNLITTWKPRLFILRGCRLSYYYSENDQEEKGLIDISSHRVLPADQDIVTSLHATLTGAVTTPVSPENASISTTNASEVAALPQSSMPKSGTDGMFIFKLVPPRSGISRAVNFTKPTIHYFAVDNIKQGRLWMAALMKATIDRDVNQTVEMTNKQKTISLKQARAMNSRPPALMGLDEKAEGIVEGPKSDETGLNIRGLSFDENGAPASNGTSHKLSSSVDVAGSSSSITASTKTSVDSTRKPDVVKENIDGSLSRISTSTSSHQPETIATRFA